MELSELNRILRNKAIKSGLCEDWQNHIWNRDLTIPELLEIYIKGFDFSVDNDWIDYDFIKEVIPIEDLHDANIYIDEKVYLTSEASGYFVFLGESRGSLVADGFIAVTVYCRHNSRIDVRAINGARVFVTYYDDSGGDCYQDDYSKCKKYIRKRVAK